MTSTTKPVLLTGASGKLGRVLARYLAGQGFTLRLTDIAPFADELPPGASFTQMDLSDGPAVLRLAEGCGTILHFGGVSVEQPFETVIGPNIRGLYHAYQAARREGARMVFASSNHVVGFHERSETLDSDCEMRTDGYYGLSKAYAELMGKLYWDKNATTSVFLRIGSCTPVPVDARMLATWLSYPDLSRAVERCILADVQGCLVIWGASRNKAMTWWRHDDRAKIGWEPQDSADGWTAELAGKATGNAVVERHQGGAYCAIGTTRG